MALTLQDLASNYPANTQTVTCFNALGSYPVYPAYPWNHSQQPYVTYQQLPYPACDLKPGDIIRFRSNKWVGIAPRSQFRVLGYSFAGQDNIAYLFLETIDGQEIDSFYPSYLDVIRDDFLTAVDRAKREGSVQK